MGFKIKKTVNGETVWEPIKAKKYTAPKITEYTGTLPIKKSADGNALIDYCIYGNSVQNGTPTPENPVDVVGCGVRTENLWGRNVPKYAYAKDYKKYNPDSAITLKAGTYTISSDGKLPIIQVFDVNYTQLNVDGAITHTSGYTILWDGLAIGPQTNDSRAITITLLADCILTFAVDGILGTYIMLNLGSTALPYEPYGYKLPMVSRTENLFDISNLESGSDTYGGTLLVQDNKVIVTTSQASSNVRSPGNKTLQDLAEGLEVGQIYILSAQSTGHNKYIYLFGANVAINFGSSFRLTSAMLSSIVGWYASGVSTIATITDLMLTEGSTSLPYQPYHRTVTNIYLGEAETTRKIKKLVLTGEENISWNTVDRNRLILQAVYTLPQSGTTTPTNVICTHLETLNSGGATSLQQGVAMRQNGADILFGFLFSTIGATAEDSYLAIITKLKSYLAAQYAAGTPVTVWYVLAEPETGIVNEPLMKIGDYVDTLTMEQADVSIPTFAGTTVIDYDGTPKPSEMYIKYNSWSGWGDIDNYKMVNENWTQEVT